LKALLTSAARRDIERVADWYEQRRDGLGLEFTDRVLDALEAIERDPLTYAQVIGDARRTLLGQFPYALWYKRKAMRSSLPACITNAIQGSCGNARRA